MARMFLWALVMSLFAAPVAAIAQEGRASDDAALRREDEAAEIVVMGDDDDSNTGNGNSGFTSGVNSNDNTGSGHTPVSRDQDRSRGDKTRDRTQDGPKDRQRDWSAHQTNDSSRRDSR